MFQRPSDSTYTSKNLTTSSLHHLDTIFNETAMQSKHAKVGVEHEPWHWAYSKLAGVATGFYMPARRSCDQQQDSKIARSLTVGGAIRVSE